MKSLNQHCSCGSSLDYRECCGKPEKVVSLAQVKWRKASAELRKKLGEFAEEVVFLKEAAAAQEIYFSQIDEELQALDDDLIIERCFEWFIFDYPLSSGQTLIELFTEVGGAKLPFAQAMLLVLWQDVRSGFYEVKTVFPGKCVVLKDLVSGETVQVREPGVQDDILVGSILYVRLLKVGNEYEFSTSAIGVPEVFKAELKDWLKKDFRNWQSGFRTGQDKGWNEYLRSQAHRLNGYIIRLGLGLGVPMPLRDRGNGESTSPSLKSLFQSETLRKVVATKEGREQLEELLRLIQSAEELSKIRRYLGDGRVCPAPRGQDRSPGGFAWPEETYAAVASEITSGLENLGYSRDDVKGAALRLWHDFCCQERPVLRKPSAWTAAVIYAATQGKGQKRVSQHRLAHMYGVAPSSVSSNFRRLSRALSYQPEHGISLPNTEFMKIKPVIDKLLRELKS